MLIYYFLIAPLSRLPFRALYLLSDVLYFLLFHVAGYRKNVVLAGLQKSFPEKSPEELADIRKKFFKHLCDLIVESFKGFVTSKEEITRRHRYTNIELLESYFKAGKSVSILGAHYGNWEWVALSLPLATKFQTYGIYQELTNKFMNKVVKSSRQRSGMILISTKEVAQTLEATKDKLITMGYIGDQSPGRHGRKYWLKFLNQDTATMTGYEHFAKQYNTPVLYLNVEKKKRGFYECTFHVITNAPNEMPEGKIAETFMSVLEGIIKSTPEYWLWSHRRWKLKREP